MTPTAPGAAPSLLGEKPMFPGSPYAPVHSPGRRIAYVSLGMILGSLVNVGNGLITANEPVLAGARGDYVTTVAMLPGIYVACNAAANLVLVKSRAQFGIPRVVRILLVCYAAAAILLMAQPSVTTAILMSAVSGTAGAFLTTLSVYFCMQSLTGKFKPLGLILGIGAVQFGTPIARLVPVDLLSLGGWQSLALIELAIALIAFTIIHVCPLPPTEQSPAFEPLDALTYPLVLGANLLLCLTLSEGRLLWWADTPWLGWTLAACIPLYAIALIIEGSRRNPLLHLEWYGTATILRFAAVAVIMRLALSEQSYGAVGLLSTAGLNNDQYHTLYVCILLAEILGIIAATVTTSERRIPYQVLCAALLIALGAWLDMGSNNLTRPDNLIVSQSLIAFSTTLFIGPVLLYGAAQMIRRGPNHLVSLVVLFSITQNIGGLAGSALLGTFQIVRAKVHAAALADAMMVGDPTVTDRIAAGAAALRGTVTDPAQLSAQGAGLLGQSLSREAAVLGFNDAFVLVMIVALLAALVMLVAIFRRTLRERRMAPMGAQS